MQWIYLAVIQVTVQPFQHILFFPAQPYHKINDILVEDNPDSDDSTVTAHTTQTDFPICE